MNDTIVIPDELKEFLEEVDVSGFKDWVPSGNVSYVGIGSDWIPEDNAASNNNNKQSVDNADVVDGKDDNKIIMFDEQDLADMGIDPSKLNINNNKVVK